MSEFIEQTVPRGAIETQLDAEIPTLDGGFALMPRAFGAAVRTGFYAGQATEMVRRVLLDATAESQGAPLQAEDSQSEIEVGRVQPDFRRELATKAMKAAAVAAGRTVLFGLVKRIEDQPEQPSRTARVAAWALRATATNIG